MVPHGMGWDGMVLVLGPCTCLRVFEMGWDGMVWWFFWLVRNGMGWDGMGWSLSWLLVCVLPRARYGMEWNYMGWNVMGWDGMGWNHVQPSVLPAEAPARERGEHRGVPGGRPRGEFSLRPRGRRTEVLRRPVCEGEERGGGKETPNCNTVLQIVSCSTCRSFSVLNTYLHTGWASRALRIFRVSKVRRWHGEIVLGDLRVLAHSQCEVVVPRTAVRSLALYTVGV